MFSHPDTTAPQRQPRLSFRRWLLIMGVWTIAALVSASQFYVRSLDDVSWLEALQRQLPTWWIWGILTPICLALSRRYPVDRSSWHRRVPLHIVAGTGVVLLYLAIQSPFSVILEDRELTWAAYQGAILGGLAFQFLTHFLIYVGIVAIGQAVLSQQQLVERETHASRLEGELSRARLQSLRAQLQPHFLFNTLHTIGGLVRAGDREGALRMLSGLSGLLRYTLDRLEAPEIRLHEELEATERYIEIEEVRFGDRLEVHRVFDPEVMNAMVPALILQPLLENAMRHGVAEQRSGRVTIAAQRTAGTRLELIVQDDGAGLEPGFDAEAQAGLGLRLTRTRLASLYGRAHIFELEAVRPRGTRVRIEIPLRTSAESGR